MAVRGSVGKATFDRVTQLVAEGKTKQEAFQTVGSETGRTAATVATAFYRVARQQPDGGGVKQRPRKRRANAAAPARTTRRGRPPRARASGNSASVDQLLGDVHRAIDALGAHIRSVEAEVRELREQSTRIEQIRKMLA
jgi:hypothetical protein